MYPQVRRTSPAIKPLKLEDSQHYWLAGCQLERPVVEAFKVLFGGVGL